MEDLADLQDSLRNLVARPGTFETLFPETNDDDLISLLLDGIAEVQLEGLLLDVDYEDDGSLDTDITNAQGSLIALFAGIRLLRAELINRVMHKRYEAGTAVFEEDYNVTLYNQILKDLQAQKDRITGQLADGGDAAAFSAFIMADQYLARSHTWTADIHPANAW